jgi:hypothetical protein
MTSGETQNHQELKALALGWAREQGMSIAAAEVSFPHRRFRVDVAACSPVRKTPSRAPAAAITSILKAAALFECKQVRSDLVRDNKRHGLVAERLKTLQARRAGLESLLHLHLPHLANGESLFPEFDSYRLRETRHEGYRRLVRHIETAKRSIVHGTKFDRLFSYGLANLHYLVTEAAMAEAHEMPEGWGLLVRRGGSLELAVKPAWRNIHVEAQLIFLQRIAGRAVPRTAQDDGRAWAAGR